MQVKQFTRHFFSRLIRHLPDRLVARDPLPDRRSLKVDGQIRPMAESCLEAARLTESELWTTFNSHPEGLTPADVEKATGETWS